MSDSVIEILLPRRPATVEVTTPSPIAVIEVVERGRPGKDAEQLDELIDMSLVFEGALL